MLELMGYLGNEMLHTGGEVQVLAARRVHVALWVREQLAGEADQSRVCRRLSAISSFYRYAATHDLVAGSPTTGVARPEVDSDYAATVGLDRDQARAVLVGRRRIPGAQTAQMASLK